MRTEKDLQNYIMKECKKHNILCHKMESRTSRGWPDLLLIYKGRVVFVEVKSPAGTGRLSELQLSTMNDIFDHGGDALIVDSEHGASMLVERVLYAEH